MVAEFEIRVANPIIEEDDIQIVTKALRERRLSSGIYAENFENEFSQFIGVKHSISVNSATAALQLMLAAVGLGRGDEIITTPYTFAATTNVIMLQGATPVFVDIDGHSYNIDPSKIEEKITSRTKAIMPIHYGGQSSDMDKIMEIARKYGLLVFEDAAPAAGATHNGKKVGSIGDGGAFSFFPDKNMTTGEGGMLTTNSAEIAEKAKVMRKHGAPSRYYHTEIGWNFKMPDPNAALGSSQLRKLPRIIEEKNKLAKNYSRLFKEIIGEGVITPEVKDNNLHTFNLYAIRFKNEQQRNMASSILAKEKIETRVCFPPVHLQPIYKKLLNIREGTFPIAELCAKTTLCIPMFSGLSESVQENIVDKIKSAIT